MKNQRNTSLSIVTISRGNYDELMDTVHSVLRQNHPVDFEIKLILVISSYAENQIDILRKTLHEKIDYFIISDQDSGLYNAMNLGLCAARTSHVMFLNSGDIFYDKHSLKKLKKSLIQDEISLFKCIQAYNSDFYVRPHLKDLKNSRKISHQAFIAPVEPLTLFDEKIKISADSIWMQCKLKIHDYNFSDTVLTIFKLGGISNSYSISNTFIQLENKRYKYAIKELIKFIVLAPFSPKNRYRLKAYINKFHRIDR